MNSKISKWISLLLLLTLLIFPTPVGAEESDAKTGSLTITVHDGSQPVGGGTLTVYPVGTIDWSENPSFVLTENLSSTNIPLTNPESRQVVSALEEAVKERGVQGITLSVPESGTATFTNMPEGLYLVVQSQAADGYNAMASFLISIPQWDEDSQSYNYNVSAYPKSDPSRKITVDEDEPVKPSTPTPVTETSVKTTTQVKTGTVTDWFIYLLVFAAVLLVLLIAASGRKRS